MSMLPRIFSQEEPRSDCTLLQAHKISFRMVCRTRLRPLGNLSSTGYVIMSSKSWLSPVVSPESLVRLVGWYGT